MSLLNILLLVLLVILLGGASGWPAGYGWGAGHYGVGIPGGLVLVVVVLLILGR